MLKMKDINESLARFKFNSTDDAGDIIEIYNNGLFALNPFSTNNYLLLFKFLRNNLHRFIFIIIITIFEFIANCQCK